MNKYHHLQQELQANGQGKMKCYGQSMLPILKSGSLLTFQRQDSYAVGDIVFCKVKGRFIDAHKIIKQHPQRGFLIANNHGHENGWTKVVFGRAIRAEYQNETKEL
ncbi:MAG: S24 family peptidase [Bacteroidetes bacterium]|nr:S24 family peptidase [Bacteroidota bacterium]